MQANQKDIFAGYESPAKVRNPYLAIISIADNMPEGYFHSLAPRPRTASSAV